MITITQNVYVTLNPGLPWQGTIQQEDSFHQETAFKFKEETSDMLHLELILYNADIWTLRKVDQESLEGFETWCWRRTEKLSCNDCVRFTKYYIVMEERNILHTIQRKSNWIGHILSRNCLLRHIIEGKTEGGLIVTVRQGKISKQLLDGFKEMSEDTEQWKKHKTALCGKLALEEAKNLP